MKTLPKFVILLLLWSSYRLLAGEPPCGYVIGWGSNTAGESSGVCPYKFSTNQEVMMAQYKDLSLRNSTGATVTVEGQILTNIVDLSAGGHHGLAINSDHIVVAWGSDTGGKTTVPTGLTGVMAIAAGTMHSLALNTNSHRLSEQ